MNKVQQRPGPQEKSFDQRVKNILYSYKNTGDMILTYSNPLHRNIDNSQRKNHPKKCLSYPANSKNNSSLYHIFLLHSYGLDTNQFASVLDIPQYNGHNEKETVHLSNKSEGYRWYLRDWNNIQRTLDPASWCYNYSFQDKYEFAFPPEKSYLTCTSSSREVLLLPNKTSFFFPHQSHDEIVPVHLTFSFNELCVLIVFEYLMQNFHTYNDSYHVFKDFDLNALAFSDLEVFL